ncbi:MAG: Nif3-like dinuclear metal center hexameric protein [Phycisphaerae bacterium]|nr:Nif3-like dinuclear metal center hexameric protein [Phycisphaerae bacterium]
MRLSELADAMNTIAPTHLAEDWDNVGLLVGDPSRALLGPALLAIDLTPAVLQEAVALRADAIVAYHPPIFTPLKRLTAHSPRSTTLLHLIEHKIALYSPHTALDAAPDGLTDWLVDQLATDDATPNAGRDRAALTASSSINPLQTHKIVTFLPRDDVERVRDALAAAGAGVIGNYELCSFTLEGQGSFRGNDRSNPTVGRPNRLELVPEARLEITCGCASLPAAIDALRATHPYEEPAFDLYTLTPKPTRTTGQGRIITLDTPATTEHIAQRLKQRLHLESILIATPDPSPRGSSTRALVKRPAAVPGSGAALLDQAIDAGADCFITGEMKHHEVLNALDRNCTVILAGHTETERPYLHTLAARLNAINPAFRATPSKADAPALRAT